MTNLTYNESATFFLSHNFNITAMTPSFTVIPVDPLTPEVIPSSNIQLLFNFDVTEIPKNVVGELIFNFNIELYPTPVIGELEFNITVLPAIPVFIPAFERVPVTITFKAIELSLRAAILSVFKTLSTDKVDNFFDEFRQGKTLLNFGNDYQALITNWQYDPSDQSGASILVKMYNPLQSEIDNKTQLWIARELSPTVIDRLHITNTPPTPPKVYLRPPNRNIQLTGRTGMSVENVSLSSLLKTGSIAGTNSDPVINQWYTDDVNSSELNINYADYREFVFFGSAVAKLNAFVNKLEQIENYNNLITFNSGSLVVSGSSTLTNKLGYPALKILAENRIDLLRSFDGYERFLYYSSGSAYSASLGADQSQDAVYFNADATWPKINGIAAPIASGSAWLKTQITIASAFDDQNKNSLKNNVPEYVQADENSSEFVQFLNLVGHQFDSMKTYIDAMTNIHNRSSDPSVGISADMVWNIAQSFGVNLPNQYALQRLIDYTIGDSTKVSPKVYRDLASETWKRFLHNQIYMMKSKGTKASLRALSNSYGILPTTLQIRELGTVGPDDPSASFQTYEEQTNVLNMVSGSYVTIPWAASSSLSSSTIELRFSSTNATGKTVLLHSNLVWGVVLEPVGGVYGTVTVSGSGAVLRSSVLPIYSGNFYSMMLQKNTASVDLYVKRSDESNIIETSVSSHTGSLTQSWYAPQTLIIGQSGSAFGTPFIGQLDEFRMWGETITPTIFDNHVRYPGLYNGNTPTSVRDNLYVRLSFGSAYNLNATASLSNEAPFNKTQKFPAKNFPTISTRPYNFSIILRTITKFNPNAGHFFNSNKISVVPAFVPVSGSTVVLSRNKSVVPLINKNESSTNSNVVGFYFSVADAINDNITRTVGTIDLQNLLGDPVDQFSTKYSALQVINDLYWTQYAYNFNVNTFIDFVRNLLEPLFKQAKELVPARVKLLSGIVHEPHLLERSKAPLRPIEVTAGALTHNRKNRTYNLEANPVFSSPTKTVGESELITSLINTALSRTLTGTNDQQFATLTAASIVKPVALYDFFSAVIGSASVIPIRAEMPSYSDSNIKITQFTKINSDTLTLDDSTNRAAAIATFLTNNNALSYGSLSALAQQQYNDLLSKYRSPSSINIFDQYIAPSSNRMVGYAPSAQSQIILPFTDFDKIESYTYFRDANGLVGEMGYGYIMNQGSILIDRGVWAVNIVYNKNDLVMQQNSVAGVAGNNNKFRCISSAGSVSSYIEPYLDTLNWVAVSYIPVPQPVIKKVILVNGAVSIAPLTNASPPVIEYRPQHYKFTRDNRLGILRHLWLGCTQDNTTTTDGKDPIEVKTSIGNALYVVNGDPIQSTDDGSGPILDVR